jgi:ABC-type Zn uptake system ZnuABC Zn-binding protein ZnuA
LLVQQLASIGILFFATALVAAEARLHVVTSFLPLYCWTVNVAGEFAEVDNLLPPRSEPHEYAFTPGDARKLGRADLIVINGAGLETWLPKFLRGSPSSRDRVAIISAGLDAQLITAEHPDARDPACANPHVWLDPLIAAHGVSNILAALQRTDPVHSTNYARQAQAYVARLQQLDTDIRQSLAGATHRAIVTYHDAFPYFARRYGLEIAGVVEQVPDVNPTPKYLSQLGRTMRERNIDVIFIGQNSASRLAHRIAADLRVELVELDTLESGPPDPSAYEERMRHNAVVLQKHLN